MKAIMGWMRVSEIQFDKDDRVLGTIHLPKEQREVVFTEPSEYDIDNHYVRVVVIPVEE